VGVRQRGDVYKAIDRYGNVLDLFVWAGKAGTKPSTIQPGDFLVAAVMPAAGGVFRNLLPDSLADELATAAGVGGVPIKMGTPAAEAAMNSGNIKWVVTKTGELLISPHTIGGVEISHAVISGREAVLAAGEAEIATAGGEFVGMQIAPYSGHFLPTPESVEIGVAAFAKYGISF
jgi:hypothetical protein